MLAQLGAEVHFYTALAGDERADRAVEELRGRGVIVHAARHPGRTRYVFTTLEDGGERTIVTVGERHAPTLGDTLDLTPLRTADGVYATAADAGLLAEAGRSGSLVVSTRIGPPSAFTSATGIDAVVFSASDAGETGALAGWAQIAGRLVATEGSNGGYWREGDGRVADRGRWPAAPLPGTARDSYGCGDSFAAGFTFGLAGGASVGDAAAIGARCGAAMLTQVGAP